MTPLDLSYRLKERAPYPPLTVSAEAPPGLWPRPRSAWYQHQKEHWLRWLDEQTDRGETQASRVYNRLQCPPMIIWLAEVSGARPPLILTAIDAVVSHRPAKSSPRHGGTECSILRGHIPWDLLVGYLATLK